MSTIFSTNSIFISEGKNLFSDKFRISFR